jgi:hypothetical protein
MTESEFRRTMVRIFEGAGGHVSMVESPETSPGVPDLNWCVDGQEGWTELKVQQKDGSAPEIRPAQYAWIRRRIRAGGKVNLLCMLNDGSVLNVHGSDVEKIKTMKDWHEYGERIDHNEIIQSLGVHFLTEH